MAISKLSLLSKLIVWSIEKLFCCQKRFLDVKWYIHVPCLSDVFFKEMEYKKYFGSYSTSFDTITSESGK